MSALLSTPVNVDLAISEVASGKLDKGGFVDWAKGNLVPMDKIPALMSAGLAGADVAAILTAQAAMIAANAVAGLQPTGDLRLKVSKRGAISVYGLNSRMPVTLYAGQCERLLKWLNAPEDNPLGKFIAGNPSSVFEQSEFDASKADQDYLAEIRGGKHPHAKIVGAQVHVSLSRKS